MKLFNTCALCATLAVPALVQTVHAESNAEEFITLSSEVMEAFAEVAEAIVDDEVTTEDGAAAIDQLTAALIELKGGLAAMSEADLAELGAIMEDEEVKAGLTAMDEGIAEILAALKKANYGDCADLQKACEAFAAAADIAL